VVISSLLSTATDEKLALALLIDTKHRAASLRQQSYLFKYGSESSRERKLQGTKVLRTFTPEERSSTGADCGSSMERKFLDFSLPRSECSTEQKFHGSESSICGNESAEERKVQIPI